MHTHETFDKHKATTRGRETRMDGLILVGKSREWPRHQRARKRERKRKQEEWRWWGGFESFKTSSKKKMFIRMYVGDIFFAAVSFSFLLLPTTRLLDKSLLYSSSVLHYVDTYPFVVLFYPICSFLLCIQYVCVFLFSLLLLLVLSRRRLLFPVFITSTS